MMILPPFMHSVSPAFLHRSLYRLMAIILAMMIVPLYAGDSSAKQTNLTDLVISTAEASIPQPRLEGFWFTCEFAQRTAPPNDDCVTFDDEGVEIKAGIVTYLRVTDSKNNQCKGNKPGQCFTASTPSITVTAREIGPLKIEPGRVYLTYYGCTQTFELTSKPNYVTAIPAKKKCFWASKRHFYIAPYNGKVIKK